MVDAIGTWDPFEDISLVDAGYVPLSELKTPEYLRI